MRTENVAESGLYIVGMARCTEKKTLTTDSKNKYHNLIATPLLKVPCQKNSLRGRDTGGGSSI